MLWILSVILLVLWLLGFLTGYTMGGVTHVLLVVAIMCCGSTYSGTKVMGTIWTRKPAKEGDQFLMKPIIFISIVLIVFGVVALAYQGITYTSREKIIDIGPIHAAHEIKKTIPLSPILGGVALAGGIVLVVVGAKNKP